MTALSMALRRGRRAEARGRPTPADALARWVGFVVLAGLSLATLAAVVLLPPYARLAWARYQRNALEAQIGDEQARAAANERLLAALGEDEVLTRRLAMSDLGALPRHQHVVMLPCEAGAGPPPAVTVEHRERPAPPDGWAVSAGQKLARPARRRGVFLLAAAGLTAALLLFAPPSRPVTPKGRR